jgi:uncharacterized protein YciI
MRLLLAALSIAVCALAQPKYEMTSYFLALLKKGPAWNPASTPETRKIQEGHMANIRKMAETGKLVVAGPITADHDLRGILIFSGATEAEVKEWCAADPAVIAGRLKVEVYPWFAAKGLKVDPPK